jgi:hypothetical protein
MTPEVTVSRARCPATDLVPVDGEPLELRCVHWGEDGVHVGDHLVHTPALVDDHTWPNDNPSDA